MVLAMLVEKTNTKNMVTISIAVCIVHVMFLSGVAPVNAISESLPATASFRLALKHEPDLELTYSIESSLEQESAISGLNTTTHNMTLSGDIHQTVADVDASDGAALVGWLGRSKWTVATGTDEANRTEKEQIWISAFRIAQTGESIKRESHGVDAHRQGLLGAVDQIAEISQVCAAFPEESVEVGGIWEGDVLLPLPGARQPGKAVSTVVEFSRRNGNNCCLIRSKFFSESGRSHATYRLDMTRPVMEVEGVSEGLFDIDRGIWLNVRTEISSTMEGPDFKGMMEIEGTKKLESSRVLSSAEANATRIRIRKLDEAFSLIYKNDIRAGIELLEKQWSDERADADWKRGIELTLAMIRSSLESHSPKRNPAPDGDAEGSDLDAYKRAGVAARAGESEKAMELYRAFLASGDVDSTDVMRVLAQYRVARLLEEQGRRDEALDAYRVLLKMDCNDDYAAELRKKAREKTGEL